VARGIVRGAAKQYSERIHIDDQRCMLRGAPACVIAFLSV
jgi:hypothetical protein